MDAQFTDGGICAMGTKRRSMGPPGDSRGGTEDYILKPALRLINNVQAGTISGTVALSTLQSN